MRKGRKLEIQNGQKSLTMFILSCLTTTCIQLNGKNSEIKQTKSYTQLYSNPQFHGV